ncbi:uncharacterized protein [Dermacentor albipictus]|uniref:uncharacterized protein isoform X2 n=1 Tax=Dermacentor albipictus TaxID=60249 RepID=UPI0031FE0451
MCTTVSVGVPGNEPTATKEGFADVLRRADEEMQWLIGATLTVLVGLVLGSAFLVSWACVCLEIFRDIRQSVLILWDTMHFRDPCYRVLCSLARDTDVKVPDYESYLRWKRGEVDGGAATQPSSSWTHSPEEDRGDGSSRVVNLHTNTSQEGSRHTARK